MKKIILAVLTAILSIIISQAQPALPGPPQNVADSLEKITRKFRIENTVAPGVIVRVYIPNNWEWSFADGIRNVAANTPATPNLVFRAASLSKMFCTTAILKLASQGVLNLNDNISVWLPPSYVAQIENNDRITIRSLLSHTSGLDEPQFGTSLAGNFLNAPQINYRDSILQIIANQNGQPGGVGSFFYSNANFNLLAEIVKIASRTSYQNYIIQNIIQPLNMTQTYLDTLPVSTGFNGYVPCTTLLSCPPENSETLLDYSQANVGWGYGAADISSTTKDLIKFYYSLRNGQIIPPNWVDSLTANSVNAAASFSNKRYGYGTMLFQRNGNTYAIGHTGTAASNANILCQLKPSNVYVCFSFNIIRCNRELYLDKIENYLSSLSITMPTEPTVTTGVENETNSNVTIYPNPATTNLTVIIPNRTGHELTIYNSLGQLEMKLFLSESRNDVDVTKLISGMYFVKIQNRKGGTKTEKLIIE